MTENTTSADFENVNNQLTLKMWPLLTSCFSWTWKHKQSSELSADFENVNVSKTQPKMMYNTFKKHSPIQETHRIIMYIEKKIFSAYGVSPE